MKKHIGMIALVVLATLVTGGAFAQSGASRATYDGVFDDLSVAMSIGGHADDFAISARILSPYFLWDVVAVSAGADCLWRAGILEGSSTGETWIPYWAFRLGVVSGSLPMANGLRLYGYGGALLVLPDAAFDEDTWGLGGYGGFGFEFFLGEGGPIGSSYFIELGSDGTGMRAEGMQGNPIYLNGFSASAGYRLYF
jgi:hypothetical protein